MPDVDGHPSYEELKLTQVLHALNDPHRYRVVTDLIRAEKGAERTCASFELGLSRSALTHHFRVLREAGLITQVDRGNSRTARLRREELERRFPGLLALLLAESV